MPKRLEGHSMVNMDEYSLVVIGGKFFQNMYIFQFQNYFCLFFKNKLGYNGGHHEEGYSSDLYMFQCANHNCQWSYLNQRLSVGRAYAAAIALPDSYAQCG